MMVSIISTMLLWRTPVSEATARKAANLGLDVCDMLPARTKSFET